MLGWRAWRVAVEHGRVRLRSAVFDDDWEPRSPVCASCRGGGGHAAPDCGCSCGLYGARRPGPAVHHLVGRDDPEIRHRVVGRVALWGLVFEGPEGWRASRAYPAQIWVPPARTNGERAAAAEVALALTDYGVPVGMLDGYSPIDLVAELEAVDDPERLRGLRAA